MERVRWENHKGKEILIVDYSGLKAIIPEEKQKILETIQKAQDTATQKGVKTLFLSDATDTQADNDVMKALKAFAKHTNENGLVEKECVVGISALQKILLQAVNVFSGSKLQAFDRMEDAKEWLAS